jgi:hypothetical protein
VASTAAESPAGFLEGFNAEGWLTKANPKEAQPHDLHPLTGPKAFCDCGTKLFTSQEQRVGKCEGCLPA